jgi:hypothetical protein
MVTTTEEMVWYNDGHLVYLTINRSEVVISHIHCPGGEERACQKGRFECIVKYFLETYGLECNVGTCECAPSLELAWAAIGDFDDAEQCQVWVIPTSDEAFAAWLITQTD